MATLRAQCAEETKAAFRELAAGHGLTESELLRQIISATLKRQPVRGSADQPFAGDRAGHGGQLRLRLRDHEVRRVRSLAESAGQSGPAWVVALIRQRLGDATPFVERELDELSSAVRQLGAIGRNLNLLVHQLMRTDQYSAQALQPERLAARVEAVHAAVRAMASRAASRVGANDAQG